METALESEGRKEKKALRWDEENLDYNEENKTPKMKIDEPPTPFNFDYCDDEAGDEEPAAPAQVPAAAPSLSFAAQLEGKMEAMASDPDSVQPTIVATAEEDEARKAAFAANRAAHYNMAAALRGHVSFEEEDEDDQGQDEACSQNAADDEEIPDDEDDAEGLSRKEKFAQKRKAFYMARDREAAERAQTMQEDMAAGNPSPGE